MDVDKYIYYDRQGLPISCELVEKFNRKFDLLLQKTKKFAFGEKNDVSLSSAIRHCIDENMLSPIEQDIFKAKQLRFEDYTGASSQFLSARHWDDEVYWPGDTCYVPGGLEIIIEDLKKHCIVELNRIVKKVNINENSVEVMTEDEKFHADAIVITVPLGVLKNNNIVFNPPLPKEKRDSIDRLGMGLLNITVMKFPHSFWPNESHALRFSQFDDSSLSFFFNLHHFNEQPILIGTHGGERAKRIENFTDSELIGKTMNNFYKVFGKQIPDPVFYFNTKWLGDPFSRGSYSYIPTGASCTDYEKIAAPINNRIFFAGEATSARYPATMHGAYLSGIREAEKIINFYK